MISELLEFTREGHRSPSLAPTDYAGFLQPLVEDLRAETEGKKVRIHLDNQPPAVQVQMTPNRLPNVFYNLVHNAVDAMPEGGQITLRFQLTDANVVSTRQITNCTTSLSFSDV